MAACCCPTTACIPSATPSGARCSRPRNTSRSIRRSTIRRWRVRSCSTPWPEFEDGITHCIQTIFPTLVVQLTLNSLAVRFFTPRGIDKTELFWIYLGYQDDDEQQMRMRRLQGNLTGAAGLVSLEDGCINEFVQRGTRGSGDRNAVLEMGGRDVASSDGSRATETGIRGFWQGYRALMGL